MGEFRGHHYESLEAKRARRDAGSSEERTLNSPPDFNPDRPNPPVPDPHPAMTGHGGRARTHSLKTWPEYFQSTWEGNKLFEVRQDDRGFCIGDVLELLEYEPAPAASGGSRYTGRRIEAEVTYKLPGGKFGLSGSMCVLGIKITRYHS